MLTSNTTLPAVTVAPLAMVIDPPPLPPTVSVPELLQLAPRPSMRAELPLLIVAPDVMMIPDADGTLSVP